MRARTLLVAIFCLGAIPPSFAAASQAQCTAATFELDSPGVIEACAAVLRRPDLSTKARVEALRLRGYALMRLKQYDRAAAEFEAAIALDPRNTDLKIGLGWAAYSKDDIKKTAALASEAAKIDPASGAAFDLLGAVLVALRRFDAAKAAFEKALEFEPDSPFFRYHLFDVLLKLRWQREALQEADRLLKLPAEVITLPYSMAYEDTRLSYKAATLLRRARLLDRMGRFAEAETSFDEIIRDHPSAVAYTLRAQFYLRRSAPAERMIADLERARALDPDYWRTYDILGRVHFYAKRYEEAANSFARVAILKPNSGQSHWWRAVSLRGANRLEEAKVEALAALEIDATYILQTKAKRLQELGFLSPPVAVSTTPRAHLRDAVVACMIDPRCW